MKMRFGSLGSTMMVCRHMPPAPGCQRAGRRMAAQSREFLPASPAVGRTKERGVFDARVDDVGIGQRRLEMPDARELPRVRRAVVPAMRARHAVVDELVADRLPRRSAVVGALDDLSEPADDCEA